MNMLLLCEIFYIKISPNIHINDFLYWWKVLYMRVCVQMHIRIFIYILTFIKSNFNFATKMQMMILNTILSLGHLCSSVVLYLLNSFGTLIMVVCQVFCFLFLFYGSIVLVQARFRLFSIRLNTAEMECICVSRFFSLRSVFQCFPVGLVHCSRDPQISFFNKTFTKNGSHSTIHTFKNYFATMFLIFSKISSIQTDFRIVFYLGYIYDDGIVLLWA